MALLPVAAENVPASVIVDYPFVRLCACVPLLLTGVLTGTLYSTTLLALLELELCKTRGKLAFFATFFTAFFASLTPVFLIPNTVEALFGGNFGS